MTIIRYSTIFIALLCIGSPGFAAEKKAKAGASPSATPEDRVAFHGTIIAFEKTAGTFTLKGKKEPAVYVLSGSTTMMKGTAPATADDLGTGVYVRGAARRATDGKFDALTVKIELRTAPPMRVEKAIKVKSTPEPSPTP
jgi:hypothetical protein